MWKTAAPDEANDLPDAVTTALDPVYA